MLNLKKGDQVRLVFPGGGGYGDPKKRDSDLVQRDIEVGFITKDKAIKLYGLT